MTASRLAQKFPGRRLFVTGAASGLGLAVIREILGCPEPWSVAMLDQDAARLASAHDSLRLIARDQHVLRTYPLDVRELAAQRAAVEDFSAQFAGIDIALNAAGVAAAGPFIEGAPEDWRWAFDINVHGLANSCRAVLPCMLRQRSGLIINVASAASFCTGPKMGAYNASKAAVVALSETLMQEYGPQGVQTLVAMPGFFHTNLLAQARGPTRVLQGAQRIMDQSQLDAVTVARALLRAAASGDTHWVYPRRYRNLWRLKRLIPSRFQRIFPRLALRRS